MVMKLVSEEIHLYFTYPGQISDPALLNQYKSLLSDAELAQMSRFYFERHRHQYLLTRALIRTTLSAYYPLEPSAWQFANSSYGKPQIDHPDIKTPLRFNLSHTDGLIMCGITRDHDIGVDVEDTHRTTRAALDDLSRYFSEQEIEDLAELPAEQQKQRFFDYWTLKESYIKARGMGLAIPLDRFSFHFKANTLDRFSIHPELEDDANQWQFWRFPIDQRYQAAVAVNSINHNFKLSAATCVPLKHNNPMPLSQM